MILDVMNRQVKCAALPQDKKNGLSKIKKLLLSQGEKLIAEKAVFELMIKELEESKHKDDIYVFFI